jgi:hypothetical protein
MDGPRTKAEWDAYRALPEWEVTATLTRTARFRMHAAGRDEAVALLAGGRNGVQSVDDLYTPDFEVGAILSVEAVAPDLAEGGRHLGWRTHRGHERREVLWDELVGG